MPQELNDATPGEMKSQSSSSMRQSSIKQGVNPSERMSLLTTHQLSVAEEIAPAAEVGKTYLNILLKPGATFWNLSSVFFLQFFMMVVANDYMTLEQPLLMNKNYYNLTPIEATKAQMYEGVVTNIPSVVFMFVTGYVYDIIGVRFTLFTATFMAGCSLMLYPLGAPHLWILYTGGSFFGIAMDLIADNTLVIDYVEKKDRGKAIALSMMGVCAGVVLSNECLIMLTFKLDPLLSWSIMSGIMLAFSICMFLTLREPKGRVKKEDSEKRAHTKVKDLTINILKAVKKNPNLLIGWIMNVLIAGPMDVFIMYLYNWLNAWAPADGSGPFPADQVAMMEYYTLQSTLGSILAFIFLFGSASIVDRVNFRVILPITLLIRAGIFYLVYTIEDPTTTNLFWFACPMMHVMFYISQVVMKSYLYKIYPKEIRGMCIMAQIISGYFFGSGYPFLIQYFFTISPRFVFFGVSMIDLATIPILLILYAFGFGKENPLDKEESIHAATENQLILPQEPVIDAQNDMM